MAEIPEDLSSKLDQRSLAAACAFKLLRKFPQIEETVIKPALLREAEIAFLAFIEQVANLAFERDEARAASRQSLKQWHESQAELTLERSNARRWEDSSNANRDEAMLQQDRALRTVANRGNGGQHG